MKKIIWVNLAILLLACKKDNTVDISTPIETTVQYFMPDESALHESTWLQWPHQYQYGLTYRNELDPTWIQMTKELVSSEKVNIIAYDETEKSRIIGLLNQNQVPLTNIVFKIFKTDDVWVRDNGPIYVKDVTGKKYIEDWGFNGWGKKAKYSNCNIIPAEIAKDQGLTAVDINNLMICEGGAVEIDGNGTLLATKSSILNTNRNANLSQARAEEIFKTYLGVSNVIWLNGVAGLEITDMHIDGFARFANSNTIFTMNKTDLQAWDLTDADISTLFSAKNKAGLAYNFSYLPLTKNNVTTTSGKKLDYKGSYINFYIANTKVLVPNYNDANDQTANAIIQKLYPDKTVVGIDVTNLYANGGMIHCVTQQEPK